MDAPAIVTKILEYDPERGTASTIVQQVTSSSYPIYQPIA